MVSDVSTAADRPRPAIRIEAVGSQILERVSWDQGTITHEPQVLGQAAHLWSRTALRPDDVDLALLYDGFTFNAISWLEALGFCGFGEAYDWLDGGRRIALDGELPVNPHGGQLSEGRTHGFGFLYEAVQQLRHDAGERQVAGSRDRRGHFGGRQSPPGVLLLQRHGSLTGRTVGGPGLVKSALSFQGSATFLWTKHRFRDSFVRRDGSRPTSR